MLNILYNAGRPVTTTQLTKRMRISWATTNKILQGLRRKKVVATKKIGNKKYWKIKVDYSL